jgi:hypothetical protein
MATLDATVGGPTANSYCTRAEAIAYWDTIPSSYPTFIAWNALSTGDMDRALIVAARMLDEFYEWEGWPTFAYQNRDWPRGALMARNGRDFLAIDAIPIEVKYAQAEFAGQLAVSDRRADNDIARLKITSLRAGPVSLSFDRLERGQVVNPLPDAVMALIPEWWGVPKTSVVTSRDLVRS